MNSKKVSDFDASHFVNRLTSENMQFGQIQNDGGGEVIDMHAEKFFTCSFSHTTWSKMHITVNVKG